MSEKKKGTITRDPELAVMALLDRKLTGLSEEARRRVLTWLQQKHMPALVNDQRNAQPKE